MTAALLATLALTVALLPAWTAHRRRDNTRRADADTVTRHRDFLADQVTKLTNRASYLEAQLVAEGVRWAKRADDLRAAWLFEKRRADALEARPVADPEEKKPRRLEAVG